MALFGDFANMKCLLSLFGSPGPRYWLFRARITYQIHKNANVVCIFDQVIRNSWKNYAISVFAIAYATRNARSILPSSVTTSKFIVGMSAGPVWLALVMEMVATRSPS